MSIGYLSEYMVTKYKLKLRYTISMLTTITVVAIEYVVTLTEPFPYAVGDHVVRPAPFRKLFITCNRDSCKYNNGI